MSVMKKCGLLLVLFACSAAYANPRYVQNYSQPNHGYYGPWYYKDYYKYNYYYRPTPSSDYQYHYCYYYPKDHYGHSNYYYYYNTTTKKYWGRCHGGASNYEVLAPESQSPNLADIPDNAFVAMNKMPPVPGMTPAAALIGPPVGEPQQPEPPAAPQATK